MKGRGFDLGPLGFGEDEKKDRPEPSRPVPHHPDEYSPWSDPSGEGWKHGPADGPCGYEDHDGLVAALRETAERDFDETFRALVTKFLWDMFWSFVKPTKGAIDQVVQQIIKIGCDQVVSQYNAAGNLDSKSERAIEAAGKASIDRFRAIFTEPMLSKEFMATVREAFKRNIKK